MDQLQFERNAIDAACNSDHITFRSDFVAGARWAYSELKKEIEDAKQAADRHRQALEHVNAWHDSHL